MGLPGETVSMAFETVHLNQRIKPELASCGILLPFPGTRIHDYAVKHNFIKRDIRLDEFGAQKTWTSGDKKIHSLIVQDNIQNLVNLSSFFDITVQHPRLEPLVKLLIKLPPNSFFHFLSQWGFFKVYFRYAANFGDRIKNIWRLFRPLIPG